VCACVRVCTCMCVLCRKAGEACELGREAREWRALLQAFSQSLPLRKCTARTPPPTSRRNWDRNACGMHAYKDEGRRGVSKNDKCSSAPWRVLEWRGQNPGILLARDRGAARGSAPHPAPLARGNPRAERRSARPLQSTHQHCGDGRD
jgi:hypothetical protein